MTNEELKQLASYIVETASANKTFMHNLSRAMADVQQGKRLITAKEAAMKLGISVWSLYRILPAFSAIKTGNAKSSTWRFNPDTLISEYQSYLESRK